MGALAHPFVRRDLNRIFDHRHAAVERLVMQRRPDPPADQSKSPDGQGAPQRVEATP
jgi:hypothetical protein